MRIGVAAASHNARRASKVCSLSKIAPARFCGVAKPLILGLYRETRLLVLQSSTIYSINSKNSSPNLKGSALEWAKPLRSDEFEALTMAKHATQGLANSRVRISERTNRSMFLPRIKSPSKGWTFDFGSLTAANPKIPRTKCASTAISAKVFTQYQRFYVLGCAAQTFEIRRFPTVHRAEGPGEDAMRTVRERYRNGWTLRDAPISKVLCFCTSGRT